MQNSKLSKFAVKILKTEPIPAMFDTGATCSCILKQVFQKIAYKINPIRKPLKVNATRRAILGPIGTAPLHLNLEEQNLTHNFIVCTKLKQNLILDLTFAQRYKIAIDWDINGNFFLICDDKKIATSLKTNDSGQWTIALLNILSDGQNEIEL